MAIVSDVEIRLRADIARLQQDMDRARQTVGSTMNSIRDSVNTATKALGALAVAFAAGAFAGWIKGAIDATDAVSDISQRTGVAIKDIAGLQLWFQKGGNEAGAFESSMIKLSRTIASGGEAFDRLGIRTRDSSGALRSNVDVLLDSADAFKEMQDGTAKTALAVELFGKSGADLIPLLNEGSEGLREMNEMAERLGLTFDEKTVNAAGDFNDTLDFLAGASQGVARQVAAQLLPTLNSLVGTMLEFVTSGNGVRQAADVIGTGFKLIYTAGVLVTQAFNALGKTAGMLAAQIGALFQGEFMTAINIGHAWQSDMKNMFKDTAKTIGDTWTGAGGEVVSALVKTTSAGSVAAGTVSKDVKRQADAYASLIEAIQGKIAESDREAMGLAKLTESQKLAMSLDDGLTSGKLKLTAAEEGYYRMLIETLTANERAAEVNKENAESNKRAQKGAEDMAKLQKALNDEAEKAVDAAVKEAEQQEELARTFGMTKTALAELAVARAEDNLERARGEGLDYDEIQRLEKIIDAKKRSAEAIAKTEDLEQQRDLWKSIEDTAHQTFVSIMDGGKDAATRLKDTFKNIFFDWLYQQTVKKWIVNISGSTSGGSGGDIMSGISSLFGGNSGGSGGGDSILGSASSLLSMGKTIYSGFTGGLMSSLGSTITSMGTTFGSAAIAEFGAGMSGVAGTNLAAGTAASAGASAASAIPVIGWIIAGMMQANSLYKQGWDFNNGSVNKLGQNLGSGINLVDQVLRGIGLSDKTANIFSGLAPVSKLFGRRNPTMESEGITGGLDANGAYGMNFTNILEKGGVFRSDKKYQITKDFEDTFTKSLGDAFSQMKAATSEFGKVLGITAVDMNGFSKAFNLVWDKDVEKREQQLADFLAGVGNDLATYLVPNIASFSREGETASTTLQRLATELSTTDALLQAMGVAGKTAFGAVGLASIEARDRLITFAGGIDALAAQTDFFAQNFLTEAERLAPAQKMVTEQMAALGYAGVTTADQFKAVLLGLASSGALATEAGANTYAKLLALAPAFKQVADAMADTAAAAADAAAQLSAAQVDLLRNAAQLAFDALQRSIDARKRSLQDAFDKVMGALEARIDATGAKVASLQGLSSLLAGTRGGAATAITREMAQAQIQTALAIAKASGVLPSADSLSNAISTISQSVEGQFSTFVDFQRDQLLTQNSIEELAGITDTELGIAQRTLASLEAQKAAAQAAYDREIARLDEMVSKAQTQIDAINGVNTSVLSLAEAFRQFASAISGALNNPTIGGQPSVGPVNQIESLYNSLLGRNSDAAGMQFYQNLLNAGVPLSHIRDQFMNSPEYQALQSSSMYSGQQSSTMSAGGALASAIDNLNTRMAGMESAMTTTATSTQQMASQIDRVTAGGNAMLTEAA